MTKTTAGYKVVDTFNGYEDPARFGDEESAESAADTMRAEFSRNNTGGAYSSYAVVPAGYTWVFNQRSNRFEWSE